MASQYSPSKYYILVDEEAKMTMNKWVIMTLLAVTIVLVFDYSRGPHTLKPWGPAKSIKKSTPKINAPMRSNSEIIEIKLGDSRGVIELDHLAGWGWIIKKDGHIIEKADLESVNRLVDTLKKIPLQDTADGKGAYIRVRSKTTSGYSTPLTSSLTAECARGAAHWMAKQPVSLDLTHLQKITVTQAGSSMRLTKTTQGRWLSQSGTDETSKLTAYIEQLNRMQISQFALSKGTMIATKSAIQIGFRDG
jgi:Domain of unknown function (DUF4340)